LAVKTGQDIFGFWPQFFLLRPQVHVQSFVKIGWICDHGSDRDTYTQVCRHTDSEKHAKWSYYLPPAINESINQSINQI